jgi:hypothetical protein
VIPIPLEGMCVQFPHEGTRVISVHFKGIYEEYSACMGGSIGFQLSLCSKRLQVVRLPAAIDTKPAVTGNIFQVGGQFYATPRIAHFVTVREQNDHNTGSRSYSVSLSIRKYFR